MKTDPESYQQMAQRRKAGFERKKAAATREKGLLIVHTGNGKGKSTAAFGMALRVLGHECVWVLCNSLRVHCIQQNAIFLKARPTAIGCRWAMAIHGIRRIALLTWRLRAKAGKSPSR